MKDATLISGFQDIYYLGDFKKIGELLKVLFGDICSGFCTLPQQSLLQIAPGLANLSVTDCGKDDPDLKEEMEKQFVDLLSEELKLQETVGAEHSLHMNVTFREARRSASQYQREAEKCNAAIETCEGARERAETLLSKEKKITLLWERRAKLLGWERE
ncbi:hypothetical protein BUALT_Bualt16G0085200 [Buddleja alternifolia]|uniref:Uncharacterized protein n=1 Tax=Buddleja alternifolia TaxID=168488 RepID=A0AAV6WAS5_9LAMI|nr:hypothetical protein BUALT_Bualt16G0085200 [Buddleja alternifolia]